MWAAIPLENCLKTFPHTNVIIRLSLRKLFQQDHQLDSDIVMHFFEDIICFLDILHFAKQIYLLRPPLISKCQDFP